MARTPILKVLFLDSWMRLVHEEMKFSSMGLDYSNYLLSGTTLLSEVRLLHDRLGHRWIKSRSMAFCRLFFHFRGKKEEPVSTRSDVSLNAQWYASNNFLFTLDLAHLFSLKVFFRLPSNGKNSYSKGKLLFFSRSLWTWQDPEERGQLSHQFQWHEVTLQPTGAHLLFYSLLPILRRDPAHSL